MKPDQEPPGYEYDDESDECGLEVEENDQVNQGHDQEEEEED